MNGACHSQDVYGSSSGTISDDVASAGIAGAELTLQSSALLSMSLYLDMITDQARNQAYNLALQAAVKPGGTPLAITQLITLQLAINLQCMNWAGSLVLDIGTAWQAPRSTAAGKGMLHDWHAAGSIVLDIGTGTGLLAMMAARAQHAHTGLSHGHSATGGAPLHHCQALKTQGVSTDSPNPSDRTAAFSVLSGTPLDGLPPAWSLA